jgi:hypothetical protein
MLVNIIKFMDETYYVDECEHKVDEPGWVWMKVDVIRGMRMNVNVL